MYMVEKEKGIIIETAVGNGIRRSECSQAGKLRKGFNWKRKEYTEAMGKGKN